MSTKDAYKVSRRVPHIYPDKRTGILQFRRPFPQALRPLCWIGEVKVSLGTRDPAIAKARSVEPAAEYERWAFEHGWSGVGRSIVGIWLSRTERDERWLAMAVVRLTALFACSRTNDVSDVSGLCN
ncbi:DUF6538 domain-containing protein [Sphingomonas sp. LHG3443-2]|uniref:DUF6538 domain-containing protein n=1 Tax=Sphingomonas sp. LHG3443-2 TaxID=2804639 RepID=UPI003CEFD51B